MKAAPGKRAPKTEPASTPAAAPFRNNDGDEDDDKPPRRRLRMLYVPVEPKGGPGRGKKGYNIQKTLGMTKAGYAMIYVSYCTQLKL